MLAPRPRRQRLLGLRPGDTAFLNYGVDGEPWHERLILSVVDDCTYIVLTPDRDVYAETISREYLEDFREGGPRGGLPAGLGAARGQPVYRFTDRPFGAELKNYLEEGAEKAEAERRALGLPAHEPEPPPVGDGGAAAPAAEPETEGEISKWVCVVASGAVAVGRTFVLPAQVNSATEKFQSIGQLGMFDLGLRDDPAIMFRTEVGESVDGVEGKFALLMKSKGPPPSTFVAKVGGTDTPRGGEGAAAAAEDARALPIARDAAGKRFRDLKSVANASEQSAFEDWVLDGPRTALYVVKEIAKLAGGPVQRHMTWKHENKLQEDEHNAVTHELLSEILELATSYDQLDISNLACMECLCRHTQYIEQRIKKKKEAGKDFDTQDYYLGRSRRTGGAIVSPELLKWVADSAARDSAILKEERKAAEERALARAPKKS